MSTRTVITIILSFYSGAFVNWRPPPEANSTRFTQRNKEIEATGKEISFYIILSDKHYSKIEW